MKRLSTAVTAFAWMLVCAWLYGAWPGLGTAIGIPLPRTLFVALGFAALVGLRQKERWMQRPMALATDVVAAVPPLAAIAFFLHPFLVDVR